MDVAATGSRGTSCSCTLSLPDRVFIRQMFVCSCLPCTDACSCDDCENQVDIYQSPDIQDGDDDLSESSDAALGFIDGEAEVQ